MKTTESTKLYTVLLVDDDRPARSEVARQLEAGGYPVIEADCGLDALRRLEQLSGRRVHIVVTRTEWPRMTGLRLVEVIRKIRPDLPVVLLGDTPEDLRPVAAFSGNFYLILTPVSRDELNRALERAVGTAPRWQRAGWPADSRIA